MLKNKYGVFLVGYQQGAPCCLSNEWRVRHLPSKSSPSQPGRDLWVHSAGMFMSGQDFFLLPTLFKTLFLGQVSCTCF